MASPATLHIITDCGLQISFNADEYQKNPRKGAFYEIHDDISQGFTLKEGRESEDWVGFMSPISNLSLPSKVKERAGIKQNATQFAFLHPPRGLAGALDWRQLNNELEIFEDNVDIIDLSIHSGSKRKRFPCCGGDDVVTLASPEAPREWALACFSVLGGFIYFDAAYEVLAINAISLSKRGATSQVHMGGPFQASPEVVQQMKQLGRFEVLPLSQYHESGYVAKVKRYMSQILFQTREMRLNKCAPLPFEQS